MRVYYIHVNAAKKSWTIHSSKACILAAEVRIEVPSVTVYKPKKKDNPRWFIRARGYLRLISPGVYAITKSEE